ncbi:unnamed protein product [Sphagnum balticum]
MAPGGRMLNTPPLPVPRPFNFTDVSQCGTLCALQHPHGSERTSDLHVLHATRTPRMWQNRTTPCGTPSSSSSACPPGEVPFRLLILEMGTGYDQHGQDVTAAAVRACKDAICSNSIPAFSTGVIPGINKEHMKLKVKLGVPHSVQGDLDLQAVKSVFPYGEIVQLEVVDGGLVCSSGVQLEDFGDKSDNCYVVNAAVYVGY